MLEWAYVERNGGIRNGEEMGMEKEKEKTTELAGRG